MRQGYKAEVLRSVSGDVVGVSLGADYCAEHEWGIGDMRRKLGMKDDAFGIDRRRIVDHAQIRWYECAKFSGLWLPPWPDTKEPNGVSFQRDDLWCGWSDKDLGAFGFSPKTITALSRVYDAVNVGNGAMWLGGGGVFQNAGLVLAIASALPVGTAEAWEKADRDAFALKRDAAATGIENRLRASDKRFFALSPKRFGDQIKFWLNPMEQNRNHSGWFTVAELDQWIAGNGPIIKKQTEKRR